MFPDRMGVCKIMAKLLCRCNLLKSDDIRLKNLTSSNRWCELSEFSKVEDVRHLILDCPATQEIRDLMFQKVDDLGDGHGNYWQMTINERLDILLGSLIDGFDPQQMVEIWLIGASYIGAMYSLRVKSRKGIG